MATKSHGRFRRKTPWDSSADLTPVQEFLRMHYKVHYEARHPKLSETGEAGLINSFVPSNALIAARRSLRNVRRPQTGYNDTSVSVAVHSFRQPTRSSMSIGLQSVNGWSIA